MRSVTFSPPPPIHSGSRACTGFGSHRASVSVKYSPSKLVTSWVSSPRTHWIASSTWRRRTGAGGNSMPYAAVLLGQPAAAEPERDAPVRELVERRHRVGQHRRDAGSRPSRRGCRSERVTWSPRARRGSRPPRGSAGSRCRRRRRSGPRSRSSRSRDPRCAATAPGARRCSCSAAPCARRTSRARTLANDRGRPGATRSAPSPTVGACSKSNSGRRLREPVMLVALTGWVDGGLAGTGTLAAVAEALESPRKFASIDLSDLLDLQQTRPTVSLDRRRDPPDRLAVHRPGRRARRARRRDRRRPRAVGALA